MIRQNALSCESKCPWHKRNPAGRAYTADETWAEGSCPILCHTLYPYFLALQHGARFSENAEGDCAVGCPAMQGVDTIVRRRPWEAWMEDPRIVDRKRPIVFAEVVRVRGECPYRYEVGQRIIFPTCMNAHFPCPAGINNATPMMQMKWERCIDRLRLRCPDWHEEITYSVKNNA